MPLFCKGQLMHQEALRPDAETLRLIEEFLHELLEEQGLDPKTLLPHLISQHMHCAIYPTGAMLYSWKGLPLLEARPVKAANGSVEWLVQKIDPVTLQ